ncbi:MAG: glutamate synthase subunit alpha, partial [Myxococcales bacterium]|nr:glutamate synthase subunit alpha [Myxococcales bacterium]
MFERREHAACGVGFVASLDQTARHEHLTRALSALAQVEHRGGLLADGKTGDGAGVMAEVPYALLGVARGQVAVGTLFMMLDAEGRRRARATLEATLATFGLEVVGYREVPTDTSVLGRQARETLPHISHVFVAWPAFCRTEASFNARLHLAKQALRSALARADLVRRVYMVSLSTSTIVYKALVPGARLPDFYPDLRDERFATRFALFHRRFSTNTTTSWDKAQPFRMIAHNGEINTIACNRAWAVAREQALGLPPDELLTRSGISDSGSLNEMVEALRYRSSIPHLSEVLAIMVPPAGTTDPFYGFWGRALEPWDGPAFLAYSDGETVGARLDRNGFRPCRWAKTKDAFYLASEAGIFALDEGEVMAKGHLQGGSGAHVELNTGELVFTDPAHSRTNEGAHFDPRVQRVGRLAVDDALMPLDNQSLFGFSEEERDRILEPMADKGKEPIGSMGDTARLAVLSDVRRSFFDFFFQTFAQVTNPPLDALRERTVTDLSMYLGKKPNIFQPKELVPLTPGLSLKTPVLSLEEMAWIREAPLHARLGRAFEVVELSTTFARHLGPAGLAEALDLLQQRALQAIEGGCSVLILSDRLAKPSRPPIPSLLALRAVAQAMTDAGRRLNASLVVDTGDARTTHHVAALVGFGAAAVCPYLAFALVRDGHEAGEAARRSERLQTAVQDGLLKIMSKMGISTARGYQGAQLFTPVGLGPELLARYFPGHTSAIGGLELEDLAGQILDTTEDAPPGPLPSPHLLREHNKGDGERHSMTSAASRLVHEVAKDHALTFEAWPVYQRYLESLGHGHPVSPRHLLRIKAAAEPLALEDVQPRQEILRTLGSGAMSFGAISAESQRDLIHALRKVGGRSSSGEGGENPYYYVDGTTATVKQVASGRFGVTAEYLVTGKEIEIKVAQGAKPGEGGQLMAVKVDEHIARARHSNPGVDLISPPPLHDIYSIEDLRQLIYELRQLAPEARVIVKLVSGAGIGAIAAGVVKAGADVIQISGGDGGTGAASISSMRHAGLPWELGLADAHQTLVAQDLREHVVLRVDGGLSTGEDIVKAALLGGEEFGFGKLLLIAEGCIMARVCEKNTCPRGIATHDPKYKAKYRGDVDDVVTFLNYLAEDVRRHLAKAGVHR